ncbi:hypothetical protein FACS1894152_3790 [Bacilli bacterium]|nr:hypothetical protein FACS1894152_3790 [Bacilli bacterium]
MIGRQLYTLEPMVIMMVIMMATQVMMISYWKKAETVAEKVKIAEMMKMTE